MLHLSFLPDYMANIRHQFSVWINLKHPNPFGPYTDGIWARSPSDVEALGDVAELTVRGRGDNFGRFLDVDLDERDPRLGKLYEAILEMYNLKPSLTHCIPESQRSRFFGVTKKITWTRNEIDASELLWLRNSFHIGKHANATEEQLAREEYVAEVDSKQRTAVQFGSLMPFTALAVAEPLRSQLIGAGLKGLHLPPVVFVPETRRVCKPLWALKSTVILPRPMNLLQGEQGNEVEPNTEWWCWWDDGGRDPAVLHYKRKEVDSVGAFDIAMTNERVGQTNQGAYRQCIVSQKFREVMTKLKVKGVDYVPVELA